MKTAVQEATEENGIMASLKKEKEERDRPSFGSRDKQRQRIHVNPPRIYTSTEVNNYQSGLTVVPNKEDRQFRSLV